MLLAGQRVDGTRLVLLVLQQGVPAGDTVELIGGL